MGVTHLGAAFIRLGFTSRFMRTFNKPGIGDKVPDLLKTAYVMDLIENGQSQDLADT